MDPPSIYNIYVGICNQKKKKKINFYKKNSSYQKIIKLNTKFRVGLEYLFNCLILKNHLKKYKYLSTAQNEF